MRNANVLSMPTARRSIAPAVLLVAAAVFALPAERVLAQASDAAEITISKPPGGYGAYGPNLPGVYMAQTSGVSPQPSQGSQFSPYSWVDPMPELTYEHNPVGWVDGWHGQVGEGIPIP